MVRVPGFEPGFPRWQRGVITATLHSLGNMLNKTGFSKRRYPISPSLTQDCESRPESF